MYVFDWEKNWISFFFISLFSGIAFNIQDPEVGSWISWSLSFGNTFLESGGGFLWLKVETFAAFFPFSLKTP